MLVQRLDQQRAETGPREDHFDRHRAAQNPTDAQGKNRDDGGQGMAKHMLQVNAPARQALGVEQHYEVALLRLDHRDAGDPRDERRSGQTYGENGEHKRLPRLCARDREPAQLTENGRIIRRPSQKVGKVEPSRTPPEIT